MSDHILEWFPCQLREGQQAVMVECTAQRGGVYSVPPPLHGTCGPRLSGCEAMENEGKRLTIISFVVFGAFLHGNNLSSF